MGERLNFYPFKDGICVNGIIYRLSGFKRIIIAFNVKGENFRRPYDHNVCYYCPIEVNDKLAIIDYDDMSNKYIILWV